MGTLIYEQQKIGEIDDRTLAHLHVVMAAKLRRQEAFFFTWNRPVDQGSGRKVVWIHPRSALSFEFGGNRMPTINRQWIELLMSACNSAQGLQVLPEPEQLIATT